LLRLEQDGLVVRSDHGLTVRVRTPEATLDVYETRIVLECAAARMAADRRTDQDVRRLKWTLDSGDRIEVSDRPGLVEANLLFHRPVWRATHNESLIDLLERLRLHLTRN